MDIFHKRDFVKDKKSDNRSQSREAGGKYRKRFGKDFGKEIIESLRKFNEFGNTSEVSRIVCNNRCSKSKSLEIEQEAKTLLDNYIYKQQSGSKVNYLRKTMLMTEEYSEQGSFLVFWLDVLSFAELLAI
ncbi:10194_t:CDS:2 [Cetraspora pellucida]|uniref:10194_t:CDS:1 n=1 Tax=Cetraspora pellucida TaxID=1433469 RepID=A0A9N9B306_9GLOM|nr:10194_t:CDS:2 [Cetraspora pellucida]